MATFSLLAIAAVSCAAVAQTIKVPPTSRTVFKCTVEGKVVYSDEPCLGAKVINVEPTRGLSKSTGREVIGNDVRNEMNHEMIVQAVKPITGMSQQQFDKASRRFKLTGPQQAECRQLDSDLPAAENAEHTATKENLSTVQGQLLSIRARYRAIGC